jgi:23S rRNA (cytidine1920-2'-O)/16S rRNA (cytidine1409-2'-O)-methyltransferase
MPAKTRIDRLLVERGLFDSRAKAQAAIEAGLVKVNGKTIAKASEDVAADAAIEATPAHPYVSRGALKLVAALDHFKFDPKDRICLDVGASTGGFTQVLLARGAAHVTAVDVGHGQLAAELAADPRITSIEGLNARDLAPADLGGAVPDFIVSDVSFISLKLALAPAMTLAEPGAHCILLVKPQFEAGRGALKKGIVRDPAVHAAVTDDIARHVEALGWRVCGVMPSPIHGGDGNAEFLIGARRD